MYQEYHYQVPWMARSPRPGKHRSTQVGSGMMANRSVPLHSGADLRRLDIRARIADPMQRWWVRETLQRDAINVWLVADLSSSMSFGLAPDHSSVLHDFATATAHSAVRSGDAFGFVAADDALREELSVSLTRRAGAAHAVHASLQGTGLMRQRTQAHALAQCAMHMSTRKSLVFLVSDFLLEISAIERTLDSLAHHHVVPVVVPIVLPTPDALAALPHYGWVTFNDVETGKKRSLLIRPALKTKLQLAALAHKDALNTCFTQHGLKPLYLSAPFNADEVTQYFYAA
jgi:uncharacterized protein (DUF58 family)